MAGLCSPSLSSPVDSVRAAAFVCIGELLQHVPAARERFGDEWLTSILAHLTNPQQPLLVQHKVALPLIQLATTTAPDEDEEGGQPSPAAPSTASTARVERLSAAVLGLLEQAKETGLSGVDDREVKQRWQLIALLAAAMEGAGRFIHASHPSPSASSLPALPQSGPHGGLTSSIR